MKLSYLALGDSYTIGEGLPFDENFPSQTVALLNQSVATDPVLQIQIALPKVIAKTGWTTDELNEAIDEANLNETFDIVSLLIGVNNQYRGRTVDEYKDEFESLLRRAIGFAGNRASHVFVLSIPDWGVTAFADGKDRYEIAVAIDAYNEAARMICNRHEIIFIDNTVSQRMDGTQPKFLVADKLHPSKPEYAKWAIKLAVAIKYTIENE